MNVKLNTEKRLKAPLLVLPGFSEFDSKKNATLVKNHWPKEIQKEFSKSKSSSFFKGSKGEHYTLHLESGHTVYLIGLGEKKKITFEILRRELSKTYRYLSSRTESAEFFLDDFLVEEDLEKTLFVATEALGLSLYEYQKYKSASKKSPLKEIIFRTSEKKFETSLRNEIERAELLTSSINLARDFISAPCNDLHSENFAKAVISDAKKIKNVKIKLLSKKEIQKEKMGCFLAVNQGSHYEPKLVHLTYTPKKLTKKSKHLALVGKGLTFDTGGYCLKPSTSIAGMKSDMAGAATVYAAFRFLALNEAPFKLSCFLGMTDNAISSRAVMPDAIVKARNGKTVEILNTDAEGRLVLADVLDYACDQSPDVIIDSATLTGACIVALGGEFAGVMGNNEKLNLKLLESSKAQNERLWELPIVDEFRDDIKSSIADLRNIGMGKGAGAQKGAAFLEAFIKNNIPWAHLDIAGNSNGQTHLPYCPSKDASGLMVRTIIHYAQHFL